MHESVGASVANNAYIRGQWLRVRRLGAVCAPCRRTFVPQRAAHRPGARRGRGRRGPFYGASGLGRGAVG